MINKEYKLIYKMVEDFYIETAGKKINSAAVLAFQTFGEFLRWNSHYHAIILEGGFDNEGNFVLQNTLLLIY